MGNKYSIGDLVRVIKIIPTNLGTSNPEDQIYTLVGQILRVSEIKTYDPRFIVRVKFKNRDILMREEEIELVYTI